MQHLLIILIVFVFIGCQQQKSDFRSQTTITKGNLEVNVKAYGALSPLKETIVRSPDNRIIAWIIPEGTQVKKGDLLFKLESNKFQERLSILETRYIVRQAEMARVKADCNKRLNRAKNNLRAKQSQLHLARLTLKNIKSGALIDELDKIYAHYGLETASLESDNKKAELTMAKDLHSAGAGSEEILEDKQAQKQMAQLAQVKAQLSLNRILQGPDSFELEELKLALKLAYHNVGNAKKYLTSEKKRVKKKIRKHRKRVRRFKKAYMAAKRKLNEMAVYAPISGRVLYKMIKGKKVVAGMQSWKGLPLVSIPQLRYMKLEVKIGENVIAQIKKGQQVRVYLASNHQKFYNGVVTSFSAMARDEFEDYDSKTKNLIGKAKRRTYDVTIKLLKQNPNFIPGIFARVEIIIAQAKDVVLCPKNAILKKHVLVKQEQKWEKRAIEQGLANKFTVEIKYGLQPGNQILLDIQKLEEKN